MGNVVLSYETATYRYLMLVPGGATMTDFTKAPDWPVLTA
jgi:hypothetical protein